MGNMDERTIEISELYTRIIELQNLQNFQGSTDVMEAINDHIEAIRKRIMLLQAASIPRTNA